VGASFVLSRTSDRDVNTYGLYFGPFMRMERDGCVTNRLKKVLTVDAANETLADPYRS